MRMLLADARGTRQRELGSCFQAETPDPERADSSSPHWLTMPFLRWREVTAIQKRVETVLAVFLTEVQVLPAAACGPVREWLVGRLAGGVAT